MELHLASMAALLLLGFFAGSLGAIVGLGGGVIITPVLALGFGIDLRVAVATSLFGVLATSSAASSIGTYTQLANIRLGMVLEVFTVLGGISGSVLAFKLPQKALLIILSMTVASVALLLVRSRKPTEEVSKRGESHASAYRVRKLGLSVSGFMSFIAGALSGLLGVGGGFIRVPTMRLAMGVPLKVAAATSNAMLGITAAVSLTKYLANGFVHLSFVAPVALGAVGGALIGATKLRCISPRVLQRMLAVVLLIIAIQLLLRVFGGSFDK